MRCQNCPDKEATVHIHGTKATRLRSGGESYQSEEFAFHFCETCAAEYRCAQSYHTLFPNEKGQQITEQVRVMSVTPERTVLRLIRTVTDATPEEWSLLTSRMPKQSVGTKMTVTFTPSELAWMKGERELG